MQSSPATRSSQVQVKPHLKGHLLAAQRSMYAACRTMNLPTGKDARDAMIDGINSCLGYRGSKRLISRTQLTIPEMQLVESAILEGRFNADWELLSD